MRVGAWAALVFLPLAACSDLDPLVLPEGCQPLLAGADCFMPYPSDFFRAGDVIETNKSAKLRADDGTSADVSDWAPMDGFSRLPILVTSFLQPVSATGMVGALDPPENSLNSDSSVTLLIDAETNTPVPHFADLDPLATDPARQAIVIHPLVGLMPSRRYVAAVFGVVDDTGDLVDAPEGFRRIRDQEAGADPSLAGIAERYEADVFEVLAGVGLERQRIQLAWDFTTGPDETVSRDMFRMRQLVMEALEASPPTVNITSVVEDPEDSKTWRTITGILSGPSLLTEDTIDAPLARDASGQLTLTGTIAVRFIAQIPRSAREAAEPVRVAAYGHGFFGSRRDVLNSNVKDIAQRLQTVMIATDWRGMAEPDRGRVVVDLVDEPWKLLSFSDQVHQGMANFITLTYAMRNVLPNEEAFQTANGAAVYDGAHPMFLGVSMGGILGGTLAALSPDIARFCLNVGGGGFTHIMFRSKSFAPFHLLMQAAISDPLEIQKYTASLQRHFDRFDPAFYARYVFEDKAPMSPPDRQVLLQIARADTRVPTLWGAFLARQLALPLTVPSAMPIWGLEDTTSAPSGATVFDFGEDDSFTAVAMAPEFENDVHDEVRRLEAAHAQMDAFFHQDGIVTNPCDGPCDPE